MITLHVQELGDRALVSREELDVLVKAAQQQENVQVLPCTDDLPTLGLMQLVERGAAFDWLGDPREDMYTVADLKERFR